MVTSNSNVCVLLACIALVAGPAAGALVNGDFSLGTAGWNAQAASLFAGDASYDVISAGDPGFNASILGSSQDVFYGRAWNSYEWTGGAWVCEQTDQYGQYKQRGPSPP